MSLIAMPTPHGFRPVPLHTAALAFLAERRLFFKGLFPAAPQTAESGTRPDAPRASTAPARPSRLIV